MQASVVNWVDGIVAECGGSCMCATCHVYVREDQLPQTPAMQTDEDAMLEGTASPRKPNSRLSCQLVVSPEMEGLVVYLPEPRTEVVNAYRDCPAPASRRRPGSPPS